MLASKQDQIWHYEFFQLGKFLDHPIIQSTETRRNAGFDRSGNPRKIVPDGDQREAFQILIQRAQEALDDRKFQQQVFTSIEDLTPQMNRIQQFTGSCPL